MYELGQEEGTTFIIGNLYIGGYSPEKHWNNAAENKQDYSFRKIDSTGNKTATPKASLLDGITDEEWDYISFQQNSRNAGVIESYFPYLTQLTTFVKEHATNPEVEFIFHPTWAYAKDSDHRDFPKYDKDQQRMYKAITRNNTKSRPQSRDRDNYPRGYSHSECQKQFYRGSFLPGWLPFNRRLSMLYCRLHVVRGAIRKMGRWKSFCAGSHHSIGGDHGATCRPPSTIKSS